MPRLDDLRFDNQYARLGDAFAPRVDPTPIPAPHLVSFNPAVAQLIGLDAAEADNPAFIAAMAGNRIPEKADPVAAIYAGHQFGHWVPQLGDGRAILLGQVRDADGNSWDLNLKGAGETPFSRSGDGRAVLRSSIREYLCSAAMEGLGIPTTRALCLIGTPEEVYREQIETGAIVCRVAESHVRFGSFELFFSRGQFAELKQLADHVIDEHFPEIPQKPSRYRRLFKSVVERTARLMAQWQAVGFCHGVMNTDNMSILGLTLDYGPFGFLDGYDAGHICNHSDHHGRYSFDNQPGVGLWNLQRLAHALSPLIPNDESKSLLDDYERIFVDTYLELMTAKLGLLERQQQDAHLITDLLALMQQHHTDYSLLFRRLGAFSSDQDAGNTAIRDLFIDRDAFDAWARRYRTRLSQEGSVDVERQRRMDAVNPKYVLRNYVAQEAIQKAEAGDFALVNALLPVLQQPCEQWPAFEAYAGEVPAWAQSVVVGCSA